MDKKTLPHHKYSYIPKQNRKLIYEYLFKEGVIVVEKDAKIPRHPHLNIPNLHIMMTLKSLKSRKYVEEKYNWKHQYFILNNEGIEFLREFLHLPPSIFPATLSKKTINRAPKIDDEFSRELRQPMGRGRMYDKRNFD
ncbi:40S ribosomal protein S10, putative [Plasmodium berghei]|uniref:40S ribosomal protein S10, putative n=6 Tax=Plasmodium (Vinckeia) TaxID=418101 RepID=A0A509AH85_PLABA|nr:40S ribosomal protein S10, putative [Plasmodium berghei ANKA]EUD71029.1 30S ribosomal protein S10e [Plasmodium vinckei petteri]CAD2088149.1 40S ribosomal protein S10, putative [Plasmodium vinckei brucechwatti]CAD2088180.1 40S ribosomal protein S10, putative [Plasmodium vinckei lentum]CAD2100261.1 40S ribosomal protein S10, putative [Plasmodium vinckei]CXI19458.1 40S ribosomal protein S10, putative [Plasmodium berghei]|eukprot:XP_034420672.1 40S ribosomal protein S10, putative [Plasmodium berghei ANKA]